MIKPHLFPSELFTKILFIPFHSNVELKYVRNGFLHPIFLTLCLAQCMNILSRVCLHKIVTAMNIMMGKTRLNNFCRYWFLSHISFPCRHILERRKDNENFPRIYLMDYDLIFAETRNTRLQDFIIWHQSLLHKHVMVFMSFI